jgi:outer membrane protein OmpA-like peptidoglycan-associated protein
MKSEWTKIIGRAAVLCLLLLGTASCSSTKTLIVLLPDENHAHGAVAISQGDGATVLNTPMTAVRVDTRGRVEKEAITKAEVEKHFGELLATLPPKPISFTLYFEEGSTDLVEDSKNTLLELFAEVAKRQAVEVQVTGHTDTLGKESDNDRLSEGRAQAIKGVLIAQGLKSNFIRAVGRGSRELLIPTPPNVREPRNRRVEVIVR